MGRWPKARGTGVSKGCGRQPASGRQPGSESSIPSFCNDMPLRALGDINYVDSRTTLFDGRRPEARASARAAGVSPQAGVSPDPSPPFLPFVTICKLKDHNLRSPIYLLTGVEGRQPFSNLRRRFGGRQPGATGVSPSLIIY